MAFWLRSLLQIHPVAFANLELLRSRSPCRDALVSLADLPPATIRKVHGAVAQNRSLCEELRPSQNARLDESRASDRMSDPSPSSTTEPVLAWTLQHDTATSTLQIEVTVTIGTQAIDYMYFPTTTTPQDGLCTSGAIALQGRLYVLVGGQFCEYHRRELHAFLGESVAATPGLRALATLAHHNLAPARAYADSATAKVVVLSPGAQSLHVVVECLFAAMYPTTLLLVLQETELLDIQLQQPGVVVAVVVSTFDDRIKRYRGRTSRRPVILRANPDASVGVLRRHPRRAGGREKEPDSAPYGQQLHVPAVSTLFGQSIRFSPLALLQPPVLRHHGQEDQNQSGRGDVCVLTCKPSTTTRTGQVQSVLELFRGIDTLDTTLTITTCHSNQTTLQTRSRDPFYLDSAVRVVGNCTVVVAIDEFASWDETIVVAFLAGAIPISIGPHRSIAMEKLWNPRAIIHCGGEDIASLRACALTLQQRLHAPRREDDAMRKEPLVTNTTAFYEWFSWHPDVTEWMATVTAMPSVSQRLLELEHSL